MTEGEERKLDEAERGDRALRSIALFVEKTSVLSHPNIAQPALSLQGPICIHNQLGEATNRRPIPSKTGTVQTTLILDPLVRIRPTRLGQPLVPRTTKVTGRRPETFEFRRRAARRSG
jgi:hypothetical protein